LVELFQVWYIFGEIGAMFIAFIGNYIGSKYWVFND